MSNRIQDLIQLLEVEIESSPKPRLGGGNKRIVDCDRMLDLLGDLKVVVPEEVRFAQTILSEKQAIISEAEAQGAALLVEARMESERMIAKETVVADANARAQEIIDRAEKNAATITLGARSYSQEVLDDIQRYLREYIDIVGRNREKLRSNYQEPRGGQAQRFFEAASGKEENLRKQSQSAVKADAVEEVNTTGQQEQSKTLSRSEIERDYKESGSIKINEMNASGAKEERATIE